MESTTSQTVRIAHVLSLGVADRQSGAPDEQQRLMHQLFEAERECRQQKSAWASTLVPLIATQLPIRPTFPAIALK